MTKADTLDRAAIARACQRFGARRLQVFGSATTPDFVPGRSDVDFLVDFPHGRQHAFDTYFGLKSELEVICDAPVDLVVEYTLRNPYFIKRAYSEAIEVYAA